LLQIEPLRAGAPAFAPFHDGRSGTLQLGFSPILVFRHDADASPHELARSEDKRYLQGIGDGRGTPESGASFRERIRQSHP
jgi:hypothetical protein